MSGRPFPVTEGALIAEQVRARGGAMCNSCRQADIIFICARYELAAIREARKRNNQAVIIALIQQGASGKLRQECLSAGADKTFCMPVKLRGFKVMLTRATCN